MDRGVVESGWIPGQQDLRPLVRHPLQRCGDPRDLVLSVDGSRGILPSGRPISEGDKGITGMTVTEPEARRARLLDGLIHGGHSQFDRYFTSANIQYQQAPVTDR